MRRIITHLPYIKNQPQIIKQFMAASLFSWRLFNLNVTSILEIGSLHGDDAFLLAQHFKVGLKQVHIVEPNPTALENIQLKYPKFKTHRVAISNFSGKSFFNCYNNTNEGISSLLDRKQTYYINGVKKIEVDVIKGTELLMEINQPVDVCKIDVEGLTWEVLISFDDLIKNIGCLHIESEHVEVWEGQKLYPDVSNYLKSKNFRQIYFEDVKNAGLQSDSIWINKHYKK